MELEYQKSIMKEFLNAFIVLINQEIEITNPAIRTYTDKPGFGKYTYSVTAVNNMGKGAETTYGEVVVKPADWILMMTGEVVVENGTEYKFYDVSGPNSY